MQNDAVLMRAVTVRRGGREILADIDLTVERGQRWVILGPNGAGKTTLLQLASTYLFPSRGVVEVLGQRLGRVNVWGLRPRIGYASAAMVRILRPELRAVEAVVTARDAAATTFGRTFTDEEWARARQLLAQAGLDGLADQPLEVLSEGERQRVQLARTLMSAPELLLLDEPTAGLDLVGREQLVAQLSGLADHGPEAVIFVTHHVEEIPPGFTHAALLRGGRLVAAGPIEEVLTAEGLLACFGLPLALERRDGRWWAWRSGRGERSASP